MVDLRLKRFFWDLKKRRIKDHSLLTFNELNLDPLDFETQGLWIQFPSEFKENAEKKIYAFYGRHTRFRTLINWGYAYVVLMDRNDIGGISMDYNEELKSPVVFIYDGVEGGIGISKEGYEKIDVLFSIARDILSSCDCSLGCFKCIHSPKCGSGNRPLDKECTKHIMDLVYNNFSNNQRSSQKSLSEIVCKHSEVRNNMLRKHGYGEENINFGVLDIETQKSAQEVGGWKNAHAMRVSCAVLYSVKEDDYLVFL